MRPGLCSLALLLVALAASACGSSGGASSDGTRTVVIYSSFPLQGASRPQAVAMNNGAKLALSQAGGHAGSFAVEFKPLDDSVAQTGNWDPGQTSADARKAISDNRAVAYLGEYNSGATAVSLPLTNEAGLAQITVSSSVGLTQDGPGTAPGEPDKYYPGGTRTLVRVAATDNVQGQVLAQLPVQDGCRNAAVVDDQEVFGKGLSDVVVAAAKRSGLRIVTTQGIDKQAANYRSLAAGLAARGTACFIFTGCTANGAVQLFKDVAHALPSARLYGSDCVLTEDFYDSGHGGLPEAVARRVHITAQVLPPEQYGPKGRKVFADYSKAYGVAHPDTYAIYGYEMMELALTALRNASETVTKDASIADTRRATVKALYGIRDFAGALGTYSVRPTGDITLANLAVYQIKGAAPVFLRKVAVQS
jgi:branched-chain amino acid transport system substrate-binding protein